MSATIEFPWGSQTLTATLDSEGVWSCEDSDALMHINILVRREDYGPACGDYFHWAAQKAAEGLGGRVVGVSTPKSPGPGTVY